jgi:photosystem II stability/assembly factor-like uncharacterized protein
VSRRSRATVLIALSLTVLAAVSFDQVRLPPAPGASKAAPQLAIDFGFVDATAGWLTAYQIGDRAHGYLYLTADGGRKWRKVSLQGAPIYVRFFDRRRGLVVTMPGQAGRTSAMLRVTLDGGAHWRSAPMPDRPTASFPQAFFPELDGGWEMRVGQKNESVVLYRTSDMGRSWSRVALPGNLPVPLTARMTFADAAHGLVFLRPDNRPLRTETTLDAGLHWTEAAPPDLPAGGRSSLLPTSATLFSGGAGIFQVRVISPRLGEPADYVYATWDGGTSWAPPVQLPRPDSPRPASTFVSYRDSQHWWEAGGAQLFKTSDGGENWSDSGRVLPQGLYFAGLDLVDGAIAWAIATPSQPVGLSSAHPTVFGDRPHLLLTIDGGATWSERSLPV